MCYNNIATKINISLNGYTLVKSVCLGFLSKNFIEGKNFVAEVWATFFGALPMGSALFLRGEYEI